MNNNNIILIIVSLVVGACIGIGINNYNNPNPSRMMQDYGSQMMGNHNDHMMNDREMSMESMMHDMNASLEGKTGDEFDREFLVQMIVHHQGAVEMAEKVLEVSKRPELIELANAIITAQESEIEMMQKWEQEWFN